MAFEAVKTYVNIKYIDGTPNYHDSAIIQTVRREPTAIVGT